MFCHAHAAESAVAKCTGCGVLLCDACRRRDAGRAVCKDCHGKQRPLEVRVFPIPPAMPITLPAPPAPAPARLPRPAVAGALGILPGLGHLYAGAWVRGLALSFVAFPAAAIGVASGALPAAGYAFFHGLVAFDGYRHARVRRGEWTREDAREAAGVWLACAAVLLVLTAARASGAPISLWAAWPALLVPLGVGLALGERANRVDARASLEAPAEAPLKPGESVDRRLRRASRTGELLGV
jgi:hypothetical protein